MDPAADPLLPYLARVTGLLYAAVDSRKLRTRIDRAIEVLRALTAIGELDADGWHCRTTIADVAHACGRGERTTREAIGDLRNAGLVVTHVAAGRGLRARVRLEVLDGSAAGIGDQLPIPPRRDSSDLNPTAAGFEQPQSHRGGIRVGGEGGGARLFRLSREREGEREEIKDLSLSLSLKPTAAGFATPLPDSVHDRDAALDRVAADVAAWGAGSAETVLALAGVLIARKKLGVEHIDLFAFRCVQRHLARQFLMPASALAQAKRLLARAATRTVPPPIAVVEEPDAEASIDSVADLERDYGPQLDALTAEEVHALTGDIPTPFEREYCGRKGGAAREHATCRVPLLQLLAARSQEVIR